MVTFGQYMDSWVRVANHKENAKNNTHFPAPSEEDVANVREYEFLNHDNMNPQDVIFEQ